MSLHHRADVGAALIAMPKSSVRGSGAVALVHNRCVLILYEHILILHLMLALAGRWLVRWNLHGLVLARRPARPVCRKR